MVKMVEKENGKKILEKRKCYKMKNGKEMEILKMVKNGKENGKKNGRKWKNGIMKKNEKIVKK